MHHNSANSFKLGEYPIPQASPSQPSQLPLRYNTRLTRRHLLNVGIRFDPVVGPVHERLQPFEPPFQPLLRVEQLRHKVHSSIIGYFCAND